MKTQRVLLFFLLSGFLALSEVHAQITLNSSVENDGSLFRYCYTFSNASANEIIGLEMYGMRGLDSLTSPDGWTGTAAIDGPLTNVSWLSIDSSFNVAPSVSSGTYCLLSNSRPGTVEFGIVDSNFEIVFQGTTTGPLLVPEPPTHWLLIAGVLVALFLVRLRRKRLAEHSMVV